VIQFTFRPDMPLSQCPLHFLEGNMKITNKLLPALACALTSVPALADATFHALRDGAFVQDWNDGALIAGNDDWSGVPSIIGYRGDGLVASAGANPQGILADGLQHTVGRACQPIQSRHAGQRRRGGIRAGRSGGGAAGSGAADAPHLVLHLDARGVRKLRLAADIRDIDGSADNAVQPLAVQYRVGVSGGYTDLADGSSGPGLATQVTALDLLLPTLADDMAQLFVRFITANAAGNDEWLGIDNIRVSAEPIAVAQQGALPAPASLPLAGVALLALVPLSRRR